MLLLLACTSSPSDPTESVDETDTAPTGDTDPAGDTGPGDTGPTGDTETGTEPFGDDWTCTPMLAGDRLDFDAGCVDGACVGMTAAEVDGVLGPGRCLAGDATVLCFWGDGEGVRAWLDDLDADGVPDADAVVTEWSVYLPYDGTSPDGLGMSASMACFVDALGPPDEVTWAYAYWSGDYYLNRLTWRLPAVEVDDFTDPGWVNMDSPDGYPDILTFSGT